MHYPAAAAVCSGCIPTSFTTLNPIFMSTVVNLGINDVSLFTMRMLRSRERMFLPWQVVCLSVCDVELLSQIGWQIIARLI